jgi:hypothetical protein
VVLSSTELKITSCTIFDILGREVFKSTINESMAELTLSHLDAGNYLMMIALSNGKIGTKPLVIR